jgi:Ferredoxin subunits of nitrite reductase and ring-hydroxylating dioxygenases
VSQDLTLLCRDEQLQEGLARGFDPWGQGRDTVLALRWRGQVRVYRNLCPHLDVAMQYRKDRFMSGDGRHIVCFAHGALFQPDNGFCVLGPCLGQSLQALMVMVDVSGNVWLEEGGPRANDEAIACASMD